MINTQKWLVAGFIGGAILLLYLLGPVLQPFFVAAILAYLGNPLVERMQSWGVSRSIAVAILFLIGAMVLVLLALIIIPILLKEVNNLINQIPDAIAWTQGVGIPWITAHIPADFQMNVSSLKASLLDTVRGNQDVIARVAKKISQSGLSFIGKAIDIILIPVVTFYLLRDWHKMVPGIRRLLPRNIEPTVTQLTNTYNEVLSAFLRGQLLIMFVLGCYYTLGLWVVGLQMALLIGLLAGLLSIIPYLGFGVGIIVAAIAAYVQAHAWMPVIYVVIVFSIGQVLEGMILTPLLIGDKTGLHPVAVIFSILVGGHFFGLVGALIAVPTAAGIMVLIRFATRRYLASRIYSNLS